MTERTTGRVLGVLSGIVLAFVGIGIAAAQGAEPGQLDRSFGEDGWVRTRIVAHDHATSTVVDSKNRIVAGGPAADLGLFGVARYKADGALDHSFSGDGRVTTRFAGGPGTVRNRVNSVAIDSRGRIVAVGDKCSHSDPNAGEVGGCQVAITRYKPNGSPDRSFAGDGKLTADLGGGGASSVAIDSQDRIVVRGGNVIARYQRSGTLDPLFGNGGAVTVNVNTGKSLSNLDALAIDSEGRIVGVGYISRGTFDHFLIARFLPDGSPDPSFGNGGRVLGRGGGGGSAIAVAIDPKDRVLAAGNAHSADFGLALYRSDGTPARRFGVDGYVATSFRGRHAALPRSVGFDSQGRTVAICSMGHKFALARYQPTGNPDRSFSGNGKTKGAFVFPHRRHAGFVGAGAIDSRDRIIAAGGESHFLLARFGAY